MKAGFSVIIPTYNRADMLRMALASMQSLRVPEGWKAEVLVIDNNCTDHTAEVIDESARMGPLEVRRVFESKQGLSHVRNRGLWEARFSHLIYLDDDMHINPGWLEGYVDTQATFDADCVVGPVEPWFEGEIPDWVGPSVLGSVTSAYSRKGDSMMLLVGELGHEIPGCNFAVRKEVALAVGGFHPTLGRRGKSMLGGEDWEFGDRLILLNKQVAYAPGCRIRHFISNEKLSKENLRKRWTGLGATQRAFMKLRNENPSFRRQTRLFLRMNRFVLRSFRLRLSDDNRAAFRWELEARRIRGFLFACPHNILTGSRAPSDKSEPRPVAELP